MDLNQIIVGKNNCRMSQNQKHGADQPDIGGPTPKSQRTKIVKSSDDNEKKVEIVCTSSFKFTRRLLYYDMKINLPINAKNTSFLLKVL